MRIIKFCINMFLLAGTLAPLGAVTAGADFLTWGGGARPSALAGAYCAVSDLQSLFFNPAGLALMKFGEVSLMHNEAGEGITRDFLAYTRPLPSVQGVLGGYFIYSSVSGIREYSSSGARGNELGASSAQTGLAYGFRAISGLYGGISVKSVREELSEWNDSSFALDAGALWDTPLEGLRIGAGLQNMGEGLRFISERTPLPLNIKAGLALEKNIAGGAILLTLDSNSPRGRKSYFQAGGEFRIYDLIAFRAGYDSSDDLSNGMRLGMGFTSSRLSMDYAWTPRGDFENSHMISLSYLMGKDYTATQIESDIGRHFNRGDKYFRTGKYLKAHREFRNILLLAPRHQRAREYLSRIEVKVEEMENEKEIAAALEKGKKLFRDGNLTSARAAFENIPLIDPGNEKARENILEIENRFKEVVQSILERGVAYYEKTDYEKALEEMKKVLALDSEQAEALRYKNIIDEKRQELQRVETALKKKQEEEIRKRKISSAFQKAEAQFEKGLFEKAVPFFQQVLDLDPQYQGVRDSMAECHYRIGAEFLKKEEWLAVRSSYETALNFNKDHAGTNEAMKSLNEVLLKKAEDLNRDGLREYAQGNLKKAARLWEEALRLVPEFEKAKQNLERARKEMKE